MTRPRIDLGLQSSAARLNPQIAAQLGRMLEQARIEARLSIDAVSARLLLSPGQVRALEEGNPSVFYSASFHLAGLRKYASLLEIRSDLIDRVLIQPEEAASDPESGQFKRPMDLRHRVEAMASMPRPSKGVVASVAAGVTLVATALVARSVSQNAGTHDSVVAERVDDAALRLPVAGGRVPAAVTTLVRAELAPPPSVPARVQHASAGPPRGRVRVGTTTWVFVRYRDNSTVERIVAPGQEFVLADYPIYVAVGAVDGTEVSVGGTVLDTSQFVTNDQVRIGAASLAQLIDP